MNYEPVPISKVGDYCEGEDGNTTLPIIFNKITSLAILDSAAGVAIATKQMWDSWGQPALRKTRMKLQLADGYVERPMGLLEKVWFPRVTSNMNTPLRLWILARNLTTKSS